MKDGRALFRCACARGDGLFPVYTGCRSGTVCIAGIYRLSLYKLIRLVLSIYLRT